MGRILSPWVASTGLGEFTLGKRLDGNLVAKYGDFEGHRLEVLSIYTDKKQ